MYNTFVVLRHTKTNCGADRSLTFEGKELAKARRTMLAGRYDEGFKKIFSSPAPWCIKTAEIIAPGKAITQLEPLGIPAYQATDDLLLILKYYAEIGDAPLKEYFAKDEELRPKFLDYGIDALKAIRENAEGEDALVITHGLTVSAIALAAANLSQNPEWTEWVNEIAVQACQGFTFTFEGPELKTIGLIRK